MVKWYVLVPGCLSSYKISSMYSVFRSCTQCRCQNIQKNNQVDRIITRHLFPMCQLHRSDKCSCADLKFDIQTAPTEDGDLCWHGNRPSVLFHRTKLLRNSNIQCRCQNIQKNNQVDRIITRHLFPMCQLHRSDKCSCADLKFDIQTAPTEDGDLCWHGNRPSVLFHRTKLLRNSNIQCRCQNIQKKTSWQNNQETFVSNAPAAPFWQMQLCRPKVWHPNHSNWGRRCASKPSVLFHRT